MSDPLLPVERPDDYWTISRRPLAALLFLAPLLLLYELGIYALGGGSDPSLRNGADYWLRGTFLAAGLRFPWILPVAVAGILGGWHLQAKHPWRCHVDTLVGMSAESLLAALTLVVLGQLLHLAFDQAVLSIVPEACRRAVGFLGAGIYEEVLFRLTLLPIGLLLCELLVPRRLAVPVVLALTSLVFGLAHYLPPGESLGSGIVSAAVEVYAQPSLWFSFCFRCTAGALFGMLFLLRGFGVTVGCHAIYDLIVGVVMQPPEAFTS